MTPEELDTRINLLPRVKHDGLDYINLTAVLLLLRAGKPRAPAVMTPATLTRYWVTLSDQPEERTQVIRAADVDALLAKMPAYNDSDKSAVSRCKSEDATENANDSLRTLSAQPYDFDHEARRVCEAIGSDNGRMTMICALHEAYEAGQRALAPAAETWQPIASAPKDGTRVLLDWSDETGRQIPPMVGFWHATRKAWCDNEHVLHGPRPDQLPTYFMPLPSPPRPEPGEPKSS